MIIVYTTDINVKEIEMNEELALKETNPIKILRLAKEAEQRNCDSAIINQLYKNYYQAIEAKHSVATAD